MATRQAGEGLVQLYEAWGRPEQASEYGTLLDNAKLPDGEDTLRTPEQAERKE